MRSSPALGARARAGSLCALAAVVLGCGATAIERLDGDPESVHPFTLATGRRTHPAVDGCQRFAAAVQQGDVSAMWNQLSFDTQRALNDRARPVGLRGIELLQWKRFPSVVDGKATLEGGKPFEPMGLFLLPSVQTLQLVPTSAQDRVVAQDLVISDGARKRTVTVHYEHYAWRIHNPTLRDAAEAP
ncbi:MAG: hypothetical protein FJ100_09725 [Deltaproteobacteria bacterium]|nr:hypothetical protein [Deltaproteobacteria bacterium]